jgi:YbbR domain-containing protein
VQSHIELDSQLDSLNKQIGKSLRILSIWPNKIVFATKNVGTKVVPVILCYKLSFEHFYGLYDTITLNPSSVSISGSAEKLRKIKAIYTEVLKQKEVNTPIKQWVNLENKYADIEMYPKQVLVGIPVSSFTEKEFTIPIRIKNNTEHLKLTLLPAKVQAHVLVALPNYEKIITKDLEAYIDLTNWNPQKRGTLPIKFGKIPHLVRIIRIEPQTVDLLVYK